MGRILLSLAFALSVLSVVTVVASSFPFGPRPVPGEQPTNPTAPSGSGGLQPRNQEAPNTGRLEPGRWPPAGYNEVQKFRLETDPTTGKQHLVPVPEGPAP